MLHGEINKRVTMSKLLAINCTKGNGKRIFIYFAQFWDLCGCGMSNGYLFGFIAQANQVFAKIAKVCNCGFLSVPTNSKTYLPIHFATPFAKQSFLR